MCGVMRPTWLAFLLSVAVGCGTSASLTLASGDVIESGIVDSGERTIAVENNGEDRILPGSSVLDIDHPGNGAWPPV
jgi:hypothetical protein